MCQRRCPRRENDNSTGAVMRGGVFCNATASPIAVMQGYNQTSAFKTACFICASSRSRFLISFKTFGDGASLKTFQCQLANDCSSRIRSSIFQLSLTICFIIFFLAFADWWLLLFGACLYNLAASRVPSIFQIGFPRKPRAVFDPPFLICS